MRRFVTLAKPTFLVHRFRRPGVCARYNSTRISVTAALQQADAQRSVALTAEDSTCSTSLPCASVAYTQGVGTPCEQSPNPESTGHSPEHFLASALALSFDTTLRQVIQSAEPPEDARFEVFISALVDLTLETPSVDTSEALTAEASHILVKTEQEALQLLVELRDGEGGDSPGRFSSLAQKHSTCGSGKTGGSLGAIEPGAMLPEFDAAVFAHGVPLNRTLSEPVQTEYGWHLIRIMERSDMPPARFEQRARLRVDFASDQPNGFVHALVKEAFAQDRMCKLFGPEKDRLFVSVATPSCIWRLDVGPGC